MSELNIPTNYHDFRKRFLAECQTRNLQCSAIQIRGLSPQGKPLFIDICHNVINPQLPCLIHVSGNHGVEGYLGSAMQTSILADERFTAEIFLKCNIIFVHALNPFGMSWYRRVNAHNVDLNRNYYREEAERPSNEEYDLFAPLLDKKRGKQKFKAWRTAIAGFFKLGLYGTVNAIAKGQYHLPESLFYGGKKLEPELEETFRHLKKIVGPCKKIVALDIHSGLGKFKKSMMIVDPLRSHDEDTFWKTTCPDSYLDLSQDKKTYKARGTLSDAFRDQFTDSRVFFATSEFGTRNQIGLLRQLIRENRGFLKLKLDKLRAYGMISAFYPFEKGWRQACVSEGKDYFFKIQEELGKEA